MSGGESLRRKYRFSTKDFVLYFKDTILHFTRILFTDSILVVSFSFTKKIFHFKFHSLYTVVEISSAI